MQRRRFLIINADDFGLCPGVNRGIIRAHCCGVVTSASLMARGAAAEEAAALAIANPRLSVGLHLDIGQWTFADDRWELLYHYADWNDAASIEKEVNRQLEIFRRLLGRNPTHIDSHQHFHRRPPGDEIVRRLAGRLGVPLRQSGTGIHYCGLFFGAAADGSDAAGRIGVEAMVEILANLPPGVTEMACHPGLGGETVAGYDLRYRAIEVRTLCSEEVRSAIARYGIELWSFADFLACAAPPQNEPEDIQRFRQWAERAAHRFAHGAAARGATG